ncbi:MAG: GntR family transcriptional regulator [Hespellia sp.]|nr:GntR family transcriptional regulator [Hespellia sp.]
MHKHAKIEQELLDQIQNKTLCAGDKLETEEELAKRFSVSRPTVRQALNSLEQSGYLSRVKGSGTFVTEPKLLHTSTSFIASYRKEAKQQGHSVLTTVVERDVVQADEFLAEKLEIRRGMPVQKLARIRRIKECHHQDPVVFTIVYVPTVRFPEMGEQDYENASFYETLEKHGLKVCHVSRMLEVSAPSKEVQEMLKIGPWEPVIFVTSVGYLKNGEAIEYAESYYPASNSKFLIELQR